MLGGRTVLDAVTLSIGAGEFLAVLGPNGAGKTTLFRAILGLVPLAGGVLTVFGAAPAHGSARVGYMPQAHGRTAMAHLRGVDVVAAAARGHRWGLPLVGSAVRREVEWALDLVDARDLARRPLGQLSGGQRQRVLLAQALLGRPRLLLLDEPLMSLDPPSQLATVALARRVRDELGATVLLSAHELSPLVGAIDRVLYLGGGGAALGSVDEVFTSETLSRLYGGPVDVARVGGRVFVVPAAGMAVSDLCHGHA